MIKKLSIIILSFILLISVVGCSRESSKRSSTKDSVINIGLSQLVEHPSLDQIREGMYSAIEDSGYKIGEDVVINYLNSQGNMENTNAIANEFSKDKYDIVVGITTPSAQALFNKIKTTPIVYSGVTDPESAGLLGDNITGVSDMTPIKKQLSLLKELLPEAKTVGMIYNSGEFNSQIQVDMAEKICKELDLKLEVAGITNSNEISLALDGLLKKVDALYVHKDNTVATAFPLIANTADKKQIPIISAVKDYINQGALATDGPSEFDIGYQTGKMVVRILKGESTKDIPFETVDKTTREYNTTLAKEYNIVIKE